MWPPTFPKFEESIESAAAAEGSVGPFVDDMTGSVSTTGGRSAFGGRGVWG